MRGVLRGNETRGIFFGVIAHVGQGSTFTVTLQLPNAGINFH